MSEVAKTPAEEKLELIARLKSSERRLMGAIDAVTPALHQQSCGEGRWTILQNVEHVVNAEEGMLKLWQKMAQPGVGEHASDERVLSAAADRSHPRVAPERVVPQGRIKTMAEARERFRSSRAATIAALEQIPEAELRAKVVPHPLVESADGVQLFIIMALHAERHAEQIKETAGKLAVDGGIG
ncbi:MAG: DinB family protein [Candidatus Korobacteraceae bacterium]|jgi:uncharacterized damage-inducible protein DinB